MFYNPTRSLKSSFRGISPGLGRAGVGFILVLNTATFVMEAHLSKTIREDLDMLDKQIKNHLAVDPDDDFIQVKTIMMRSVLNQSILDMQEALSKPGFIPEEFDLNLESLSDVINVVLYGGEGNESQEVIDLDNKIINEISIKNQPEKKN